MSFGIVPDCTLTTGIFLLNKYHPQSRTIEETLKGIETLLSVPCYLVIYCNAPLASHIIAARQQHSLGELTKVNVVEVEELWAYQFADKIRANREISWPTRDGRISTESTVIVFNKFDFVRQTISENPFRTTKFGWIDGSLNEGGRKICIEGDFQSRLLYVLRNVTDKFHLQVLNVEDKKYKEDRYKPEYYQQARWVAVGCLFTTTAERGMKILTRLCDIVAHTIQLGYGHGEEYFYLEVLDEFEDDIQRGYGDYKDTLNNFLLPTKNLLYVYWNILMNYVNKGYDKECVRVCRALLESFDRGLTEMNFDLYVRVHFALYLSLRRMNATEECKEAANTIRMYYRAHPLFRQQFHNLQHLCGMSDFSSEEIQR